MFFSAIVANGNVVTKIGGNQTRIDGTIHGDFVAGNSSGEVIAKYPANFWHVSPI